VPSSTSNSDSNPNARIRFGRWGRTWGATLLLAATVLICWELFWRLQGFSPTVTDDWRYWAALRRKASDGGAETVALVGASRIQLGFHPDVFATETGLNPIMLAIDGSSPLPVLADLARDPDFNGIVICSLTPMFLAEPSEKFGRAEEWVRLYRKQKLSSRVEARLNLLVSAHVVFRDAALAPWRVIETVLNGGWPEPPYAGMRPDRYRPADFTMVDVERYRQGRIERRRELVAGATPLAPGAFRDKIDRIGAMAGNIQRRGGRVIFVRFPTTGTIRRLESETWPRSRYWNVFAERIGAPAIHFEDYPALSGYDCPDGSHLDVRDARKFTRALVRILREKTLLAAAALQS
jgi:hypothetical protein